MSDTQQSRATFLLNFVAQQSCLEQNWFPSSKFYQSINQSFICS